MSTKFFEENAKQEISKLKKITGVDTNQFAMRHFTDLVEQHPFKDSEHQSDRDTHTLMLQMMEAVKNRQEKFFQLSFPKAVLNVEIETIIKEIENGLKSHDFTDKDEIHLYICREPHQLMVQNVEKKFDLYEEKNYKIGKFKMSDIFNTSEQPQGQGVFFKSQILPKIIELRSRLTK